MKDLDQVYSPGFYKSLKSRSWRTEIVCSAIWEVLYPKSLLDVGCGIGDFISFFKTKGCSVFGLEGSENVLPFLVLPQCYVGIFDLRKSVVHTVRWDLVLCFNVAEHIEEEFVDILVGNLGRFSNRILFASVDKNFWPHRIVNCQSKSYWVEKFSKIGYMPNEKTAQEIKNKIGELRKKPVIKIIADNLLCLEDR